MTVSSLVEPAYSSVPAHVKTLGPEVADIADLAGFTPDPEQRMALDGIFALGADNKVAALEAAVIAGRQNIKTGLFKQCALGWLFVTDQRLIIWSAHEFSTAQEAHRDLVELITNCDPLRRRVKAITNGNGDEGIELLSGQRVKFKARTKTGGRGLSGDKIVLDEAFALQSSHMGSLFPLLSARPDPQIVYGSSAGLLGSRVLREVRDRGRSGTDPGLVYYEWADDLPGDCAAGSSCNHHFTTPGCRMDDERRWQRANSQLGRRITYGYMRQERRALDAAEFGRERLGWWDDPAVGFDALPGWESLADATAPAGVSPVFAVAASEDLSFSCLTVASRRPDGLVQVQTAEGNRGTAWLTQAVADVRAKHSARVLVHSSLRGVVTAGEEVGPADYERACKGLLDAVEGQRLRHYAAADPGLQGAVGNAKWTDTGSRRLIGRGGKDICQLQSAALAVHALTATGPSVYEERGFLAI